MCGIAGFIDLERSQDSAEQLIDSMCKVIRHRGPDDQGTWVGDGVALGMRRLSIIDLAGGHQPIYNEDKSILIVFNGEIYNYRDLRDELRARGHHFETNSDTEAIVHAYEEYGEDCAKHLRGMFVFAIWDRKRHRLLIGRDRFGKKPLNYYWDGQRLIFGSEIKSILEAGIPREVNHEALDEYLVYRYVPAPNTLFKGVMKLPAAHVLIYEDGNIRTQRYWDLPFTPTCNDDEQTAIERVRALIKDAVEVRLMSEVPLGAFLSGGIDSSIVVGMMSQMMSQPVKTFSIGFEEDDYSELPYARRIAEHFGTEHHEFFVRPNLIEVLPQLVWAYDEPFADSSMLPTYYVSKLAREHVTVVLSGDGGDEIFAGYTHYARELAISRIPGPMRYLLGMGSQFMPDGMRGKKRLRNIHNDLPIRYVQGTMIFPVGTRELMYTPEYFAKIRHHNPYERHTSEFKAVSHLDVVAQMQYADARGYLIDDIMVKVDKASMFNSLETRAPLLDQHLAEYAASLPSSLRMQNGTLKYLLKRVAADLLPAEILARKKQGFAIPMKHWFRGELTGYAHNMLESSRAKERGIFNPQFISNLLKAHESTKLVNHSSAIWSLLCLELWFQVYMDSPGLHVERSPQVQTISKG
ncbi:MAG TPA: asparagine synthase (glutamine-hydrolyzing) [Ktedonobacteraceae bacterium]|nr:asparagine synthase (glutamine-hydrolyzing) [Ktedonobacteraceae bacterium]